MKKMRVVAVLMSLLLLANFSFAQKTKKATNDYTNAIERVAKNNKPGTIAADAIYYYEMANLMGGLVAVLAYSAPVMTTWGYFTGNGIAIAGGTDVGKQTVGKFSVRIGKKTDRTKGYPGLASALDNKTFSNYILVFPDDINWTNDERAHLYRFLKNPEKQVGMGQLPSNMDGYRFLFDPTNPRIVADVDLLQRVIIVHRTDTLRSKDDTIKISYIKAKPFETKKSKK
ncbi:MAG: hypothetical protein J5601_07360 [Elusimicrobiaceae bacterium]|nr:hypothetical protein [Elusimicrobiaceae bacterium]